MPVALSSRSDTLSSTRYRLYDVSISHDISILRSSKLRTSSYDLFVKKKKFDVKRERKKKKKKCAFLNKIQMLHRYLNKKNGDLLLECEKKQYSFIIVSYCKKRIYWKKKAIKEVLNNFLGLAIFSVSKRIHLQFFLSFHLYFQFQKITFIVIALPFRKIYAANLR